MKKITVYYDSHGNTLNVWFDDPKHEHVCEETGEEVVLVKDRHGKVIGFEKLDAEDGLDHHDGATYNNRAAAYVNLRDYENSWQDLEKAKVLGAPVRPDLIAKLERVTGKKLKNGERNDR